MKKLFYQWFLPVLILLLANQSFAQCPTADFTAVTGGNYNLNGNKTLAITSAIGDININVSGTGNVICIATGASWTKTNGTNFDGSVSINVYGTFNYNSSDNFNGGNTSYINVQEGGFLNTNTSGIGSNLLINNQGTTTFTNTGTIQFRDSFSFYNMGAKSKLIATAPTLTVFGTNNVIENSGSMEFSSVENADAKRFKNEASGVINISRYFYNHGAILNEGEINTLCGSFGNSACQFIIGDKGAGKEFQNNGCMTVTGDVNIRGAAFINGTLTINNGNLTIDKKISGNGGAIVVTNGVSKITSDGGYSGTNMTFWDENTAGHDFDSKTNNNPGTTTVYTIAKRTCVKAEVVGSIGDYVWYDKNKDGIQNNGELPATGVKVQLYEYVSGSWTQVVTAVTDSYGKYLFDDLQSGKYKVTFILPSGGKYFFTLKNATTSDLDSDVDTDGNSGEITIDTSYPAGNVKRDNLTVDAGIYEGSTPLPVTLISFNADKENQTVQLQWATSAETNSESFDIENSLTGKTWQKLGNVIAAGESATKTTYSFTDKNPSNGENLYRLKMIDKDGTFAYSSIKSVTLEIADQVTIYPNPVSDRIQFKVSDWTKIGKIQLFDLNGRAVYQSTKAPVDGIDVKNLPSGLYAVSLTTTGGSTNSYKVLITK
ncbi:SdrD B-like domain-containing protein [Dyadobacter subterraneus]|uniref:T9SS type A sorting domain-containing protein n=1 Tax=Dyadobacter subterraneus TaxID=2773304 RepID=A0ABR9WL36_9BACT|nr:SdrD B-like domain-containing protein [Dyadobacter subterraneus]MBE9466068.1 T9SS type A sorting domain-containing protein [Dyadobacter subterraneus]